MFVQKLDVAMIIFPFERFNSKNLLDVIVCVVIPAGPLVSCGHASDYESHSFPGRAFSGMPRTLSTYFRNSTGPRSWNSRQDGTLWPTLSGPIEAAILPPHGQRPRGITIAGFFIRSRTFRRNKLRLKPREIIRLQQILRHGKRQELGGLEPRESQVHRRRGILQRLAFAEPLRPFRRARAPEKGNLSGIGHAHESVNLRAFEPRGLRALEPAHRLEFNYSHCMVQLGMSGTGGPRGLRTCEARRTPRLSFFPRLNCSAPPFFRLRDLDILLFLFFFYFFRLGREQRGLFRFRQLKKDQRTPDGILNCASCGLLGARDDGIHRARANKASFCRDCRAFHFRARRSPFFVRQSIFGMFQHEFAFGQLGRIDSEENRGAVRLGRDVSDLASMAEQFDYCPSLERRLFRFHSIYSPLSARFQLFQPLLQSGFQGGGRLGVLQGLFDSADLRFHRDFHFSGHGHFLSRGCLFFGFIALVVFVVMRAGPSREQHKDQDQRNHDSIGEIHAAHPFRRSSSATSSLRSQSVFLPSSSSIWRASSASSMRSPAPLRSSLIVSSGPETRCVSLMAQSPRVFSPPHRRAPAG